MKTQFETIYLLGRTILVDKKDKENVKFYYDEVYNEVYEYSDEQLHDRFKIIAANPKIEGIDLLPLPEDEVEKLANEYIEKVYAGIPMISYSDKERKSSARYDYVSAVKHYKAGKQNSFTKEDMTKFAYWYKEYHKQESMNDRVQLKTMEELLQLYLDQKPKPQFIPEMEEYGTVMKDFKDVNYRPKIVDGVICGVWK